MVANIIVLIFSATHVSLSFFVESKKLHIVDFQKKKLCYDGFHLNSQNLNKDTSLKISHSLKKRLRVYIMMYAYCIYRDPVHVIRILMIIIIFFAYNSNRGKKKIIIRINHYKYSEHIVRIGTYFMRFIIHGYYIS